METKLHEPVFCHTCGEVDERQTERLAGLEEKVRFLENRLRSEGELHEATKEALGLAERDLRVKRAQVAGLKAEQLNDFHAKVENDPKYQQAKEVLEHWKEVCYPQAREFGQKRFDPVLARLKAKPQGYTVEELKRCADGYAWKPYQVGYKRAAAGTPDDLKVEVDYIYRNARNVEQGLRLADTRDAMHEALGSTETPEAPQEARTAPSTASSTTASAGTRVAQYVTSMNWALFPCKPGSKAPATPHGFEDAAKDIDRIVRYWDRAPNANIAVRCGEPSGIVVIDVDDYKGGGDSLFEIEKANDEFPRTLTATTPRGGQHYFFKHPGGYIAPAVDIVPGIDVRGDGSYVLIAPSVVDGSSYEWDDRAPVAEMPEWLLKGVRSGGSRTRKSDEHWIRIVRGVQEGSRNQRMAEYVGKEVAAGHPDEMVMLAAMAINKEFKPPMPRHEVIRIVDSIVGRHNRNDKGTK